MSAGDVTNVKWIQLGNKRMYTCKLEIEATETTAETLVIPLRNVDTYQVTLQAGGTPTEASTIFTSISGSTLTIDSTHALTGTNYVLVWAIGDM